MTIRRVSFGKTLSIALKAFMLSLPMMIQLATIEKSEAEKPQLLPSKLVQLAYFQGIWLCQIQDVGTSASQVAGEITWNVVMQTDRKAYRVQGTYVRKRERTKKILIQGLITYDLTSDRFVQIASTNGGSKLIFNSVGWQGEKLVWQGVQAMQEGDYILRRTITRKSDRKFEAAYAALNPTNSQWFPVASLVCTK